MTFRSSFVIQPQTAANTQAFFLEHNDLPARITATGLQGSESVSISAVDGPASAPVTTAVYLDGVAATLKPTDPSKMIYAPGQYVLTKSVTAAASGVALAKG